jgi:hypothetical protein
MSFAPALVLRQGDRKRLGDLAGLPSVPTGLARRARMILLAAGGVPNAEIARVAGVSRPTVIAWRDRYEAGGAAALEDAPRSGRPAGIDEIEIIAATLVNNRRPPERLDITRWSSRFPPGGSWLNMAEIVFGIITRQPIRRGTFRSVKDLTAAIGRFIDARNQHCQPFTWAKHADELIAKASRPGPRAPGGSCNPGSTS